MFSSVCQEKSQLFLKKPRWLLYLPDFFKKPLCEASGHLNQLLNLGLLCCVNMDAAAHQNRLLQHRATADGTGKCQLRLPMPWHRYDATLDALPLPPCRCCRSDVRPFTAA